MAEWGKYLKNAVANVEQQLDRVLLENQENPVPPKPKPRPDLSERLKTAVAGKADNLEDSAEESPNEIVTINEFVTPPNFEETLQLAKQTALQVQRDDVLALVDAIEKLSLDSDKFVANVNERLDSLHSKLAIMAKNRAENSTGSEQKVALLLEEGQRLSKQELKQNMLIRKLRAEKTEFQQRATKAEASSAGLDNLRQENERLKSEARDTEVLMANLRAQLKEEEIPVKAAEMPNDDGKIVEERWAWRELERQLLQRIAELEQANSQRQASVAQLQHSLSEAQKTSREAQNQVVLLQDELDAMRPPQIVIKKAESEESRSERAVSEATEVMGEELPVSKRGDENGKDDEVKVDDDIAEEEEVINDGVSEEVSMDRIIPDNLDSVDPVDLDDVHTVGPSGPFGVLDEGALGNLSIEEGLYGIENEARSIESRRSIDSLSFLGLRSRQDSTVNSMNEGTNSQVIKKLSVTVSRLQNELAAARQEAQLARQQRQDAQAEIVKYLGMQEQCRSLEAEHASLMNAQSESDQEIRRLKENLVDKSELVEELEADVRDLKDMYKEQIEALVNEIEKLKAK